MKSIGLVILALLVSVSCKSITGDITVKDTITLVKKGNWIEIEPGRYSSKLKFKSKTKMKLKIDGKTFTFRAPKGTRFPRENGVLKVSAEQTRQPYDLSATVKTDKEIGQTFEDYEICSYAIPYTVCTSSGRYGGSYCNTYFRTYPGQRYSKWHMLTVEKNILVALSEPESIESLAEFKSYSKNYRKVYVYEGVCR